MTHLFKYTETNPELLKQFSDDKNLMSYPTSFVHRRVLCDVARTVLELLPDLDGKIYFVYNLWESCYYNICETEPFGLKVNIYSFDYDDWDQNRFTKNCVGQNKTYEQCLYDTVTKIKTEVTDWANREKRCFDDEEFNIVIKINNGGYTHLDIDLCSFFCSVYFNDKKADKPTFQRRFCYRRFGDDFIGKSQ